MIFSLTHLSSRLAVYDRICVKATQVALAAGFFQCVLGTRFGSLELKIGSLDSEKIVIRSTESEKIGSLKSEKSGPDRFISGT